MIVKEILPPPQPATHVVVELTVEELNLVVDALGELPASPDENYRLYSAFADLRRQIADG